jgi:glycosyltransferase involved in cell wall biosynthesis
LIEACRGLDFPVRIIGPRGAVEGHDLPTNVSFLESTSDPPDAAISYAELRAWYGDAIAVLIPLIDDPNDTCGLTNIFEAMAMGRPIIKTRSGCLDMDVEALGIGFHVAPGNTTGWREAMQLLANDPARAEKMGARGLELARAHFNSTRFDSDMVAFTRELLAR